ncbi:MAG: cell filamentation protein Fic [Alphaproteobacteria bacterium]|nr:cell filamentation protein Fic [Alphaproteobacteria bacterium]
MILFEACNQREDHRAYQNLSISNLNRQYDFLRSVVLAAFEVEKPFLSQVVIKALNFQAITCLHTNAGEYRPCEVTVGAYNPPEHFRVQALMDDFVNVVNRNWDSTDPVSLAAYVLWRLNWIHPFINGNGRTARVTCYYVLCLAVGGWLPGTIILPELIRQNRAEYVVALQAVDRSYDVGALDLAPLHTLLQRLIQEQLASAQLPADEIAEQDDEAAE